MLAKKANAVVFCFQNGRRYGLCSYAEDTDIHLPNIMKPEEISLVFLHIGGGPSAVGEARLQKPLHKTPTIANGETK